MRRGAGIALVVVVVLAALLAINAIVLDSQTKDAEVAAPGGEMLELSSVDLQVVDHPATKDGFEGAPIVLLHCFGCSLRWWDEILPALNERHRVVTVDLIGHGGSEKPSSGYEITGQSGAVGEALNELGVLRATVVGHSLGGVVATSLAESATELVDRLVLIGTASKPDSAELGSLDGLARTPVIGQALWRVRVDSLVKSGYESAFAPGFDLADGFENPDQVVEDNRAMTYSSFVEARAAADDFLEQGDLAGRLTPTGVPLLVIDGTEDQVLDAEQVEGDFGAVPGAEVELLDGVGHSPNVEAVDETAELILGFVDEGAIAELKPGRMLPPLRRVIERAGPSKPRSELEPRGERK